MASKVSPCLGIFLVIVNVCMTTASPLDAIGLFMIEEGFRHDGWSLGTVKLRSLSECGSRCLGIAGCLAANYESSLRDCELLSNITGQGEVAGVNSAWTRLVLEDSSKAMGPYGGSSGDWFSDYGPSLYGPISSILIQHGGLIDGIQFIYGDNTEGTFAGGRTAGTSTLVFSSDEYIQKIRISMDQGSEYIGQLYFTTNKHTYGPYGQQNTTLWDVEHGGQPLIYVSGRYSSYLNALTFHWKDL